MIQKRKARLMQNEASEVQSEIEDEIRELQGYIDKLYGVNSDDEDAERQARDLQMDFENAIDELKQLTSSQGFSLDSETILVHANGTSTKNEYTVNDDGTLTYSDEEQSLENYPGIVEDMKQETQKRKNALNDSQNNTRDLKRKADELAY